MNRFSPAVVRPLPIHQRVLLVLGGVLLLAGFALAAALPPNPRGFGTHQALGLPPCTIKTLFNYPCPSCGMTTSFAHFVRGQFWKSAGANVGGFALAWVSALAVPWMLASAGCGRLIGVRQPRTTFLAVVLTLTAIALINWMIQLSRGPLVARSSSIGFPVFPGLATAVLAPSLPRPCAAAALH